MLTGRLQQIESDMLVDNEYDEKADVAIITPDTDDQMDEVDADRAEDLARGHVVGFERTIRAVL